MTKERIKNMRPSYRRPDLFSEHVARKDHVRWRRVRKERKLLQVNETKGNEQIGIFWEFVRYFNCEWAYAYLMNEIGNAHFNKYHRFNLDDFANHDGFERNINQMLDALNIIDNEENNARLAKHGIDMNEFNITRQRANLFRILQLEDYSNQSSDGKLTRNMQQHITRGRYNKTKAIELLLTLDESICHILKNLTNLIQYEWTHAEMC